VGAGLDGSQYEVGCYAYRCRDPAGGGGNGSLVEIQGPDGAWRGCGRGGQALGAAGYAGAVACPADEDQLCLRACSAAPCPAGQYPLPCTPSSPGGCGACAPNATDLCAAYAPPPAAPAPAAGAVAGLPAVSGALGPLPALPGLDSSLAWILLLAAACSCALTLCCAAAAAARRRAARRAVDPEAAAAAAAAAAGAAEAGAWGADRPAAAGLVSARLRAGPARPPPVAPYWDPGDAPGGWGPRAAEPAGSAVPPRAAGYAAGGAGASPEVLEWENLQLALARSRVQQ
jgi:hypothetical protein